jgi:hypothetical protein
MKSNRKNVKREIEWRVYGNPGQQQMETYDESFRYDFSEPGDTRIIEVDNYDITGTHEYAVVRIIRNTYEECYAEFSGQITDGIFEEYYVGHTEEISSGFATVIRS